MYRDGGPGGRPFRDGNRGGFGRSMGQELRMPPGWEDCPAFGAPMVLPNKKDFQVIPSKVPLSEMYRPVLRNPNNLYTLRGAIEYLERERRIRIGMVLDLTASYRYYNFDAEVPDAMQREIYYVKVPCRGRGESPTPAAVNHAVFEMFRLWSNAPGAYVLLHCTHGFNRTGYVMACAAVRLAAATGMTVHRAVRRFAEARPPGIYKDAYINDLFRYHHEKRLQDIKTPPVPAWKGEGDEDDDPEEGAVQDKPPPPEVNHERIEDIGEPICEEEAGFLRGMVYQLITGRTVDDHTPLRFPGSQPVSLARSNLSLLQQQRYWVSWKADGTRYLLLVLDRGCYLVDRSFKVVRLQMRFPTPAKPPVRAPNDPVARGEYPVGAPHVMTLLDGEMVVDDDRGHRVRRYLAYDMPVLCEAVLTADPWIKRFHRMEEAVVNPRNKERSYILGQINPQKEKFRTPPLNYDYSSEPFSVRRKDFWPLYRAHKVIHEMIPALSHESDGLILQSAESAYVANTDNALLKFKFAHLNSVDFKLGLDAPPGGGPPVFTLWVMDTRRRRVVGGGGAPLISIDTPVEFPEDVEGRRLVGEIIECTWVPERRCWRYLRTRMDKNTPNASHVYEKVMASIHDNIHEDQLLGYLEAVFWNNPLYEKDRTMVPPDRVPNPLPAPPPAQLPPRPQPAVEGVLPPPPDGEAPPGPPEDDAAAGLPYPEGDEPPPQAVPWSPPYYGPEPTPPHDPSQPLDPALWPLHDPSTYPQHLLEPPPPPPDEAPRTTKAKRRDMQLPSSSLYEEFDDL